MTRGEIVDAANLAPMLPAVDRGSASQPVRGWHVSLLSLSPVVE